MSETRYPERKPQITRRLRIALLICAAAAAAIPVIVYFATAEVMKRQEDLSDRLISSVANSADLNAALVRVADGTDKLARLDDIADVRGSSELVLSELGALREGFATEFLAIRDRVEAQRISEQLSVYERVIAEATDNRIAQLRNLDSIRKHRTSIQRLLNKANAALLSEIASLSADFEQRISRIAEPQSSIYGLQLKVEFQTLTLYRAITQILSDIEERIAGIDPTAADRNTDEVATKLRFLTRGLATRVAKVPNPALRQPLARDILALDRAMLGDDSIVSAYRDYRIQGENVDRITGIQTNIAAKLLGHSDAVIKASKADALKGSREVADLVRENRLAVLGLSGLLLLVLLVLLFYIVGRKFSRRIGLLTESVLAIARGDTDHEAVVGGNDELTAMSDALHVFRENRRNLLRSNSELEASNEEVREVGTRLKTILDTTTSGIIAFSHEGEIIMVNSPAREFLGSIAEPTPFAWPEAIDFLDSENFTRLEASKSPIKRALAGQQLKSEIALMERPANEEARYMRISSATVTNKPSPVRCVIVLEDVSEAEKNRQQVERAGRLDALGQLTGGIAHDFNNLLATIEYALELSLVTGVNDQAQGYLTTAIGSVRRGSELTARLLSFAKRQPGRANSRDVSDIMREFKALVEPSIEEVIKLTFVESPPGLHVYCDEAQLENALLNLVLNSRDAILRSGQGDRIIIAAREVVEADTDYHYRKEQADEAVHRGVAADVDTPGLEKGSMRYIEFSVTDNGPGMSMEVKRRALDPFFTTKKTNSGTGLGLSMVYGFIQHSDGELRLYSEEGHGTTIRLLLPSGSSDGEREGPVVDLPVMRGNGERVLIVEDDIELRRIMGDLITSLGYATDMAESGREALKLFEGGFDCDVLLTDIVMPGGIGGFELGEQVRAIRPSLPIVYMSGYTGFTEAEMGTAIGPFVQKPCVPSELSEALVTAMKSMCEPGG